MTFTDKFELIRREIKAIDNLSEFQFYNKTDTDKFVTIMGNNRKHYPAVTEMLNAICDKYTMQFTDLSTVGKIKFVVKL